VFLVYIGKIIKIKIKITATKEGKKSNYIAFCGKNVSCLIIYLSSNVFPA
jgi:hypothetical protein